MKKLIWFSLFFSGVAIACGPSVQTLIDSESLASAQKAVNDDRTADQLVCLAAQIAAMPSPTPSGAP